MPNKAVVSRLMACIDCSGKLPSRLYAHFLITLGVLSLTCFPSQAQSNPPPGGFSPSSVIPCEIDSPVNTSDTSGNRVIPAEFAPQNGALVILGPDTLSQGRIRFVALNGKDVLSKLDLQRKYTPAPPAPPPPPGSRQFVLNFGPQTGPPIRKLEDGWNVIAFYTGADFRYRLELCVDGKYKPIVSPESKRQLSFSSFHQDDVLYIIYGSSQVHPDPTNVLTSVSLAFTPKPVSMNIEVEKHCEGIPGVAAHGSSTVRVSLFDPSNHNQPIRASNIGASILYDGVVHGDPSDDLKVGVGNLPAAIHLPGEPPDMAAAHGYVDTFPYGSPITRNANDVSEASVDESSFAVRVGGPCRGFLGAGRVRLYDGRVFSRGKHSE